MVIWQEDASNCCTANNMDYGPTTIREEYIGTLQKQTVSNKIYIWVNVSAEKSSSTNYVWILMGRYGLD